MVRRRATKRVLLHQRDMPESFYDQLAPGRFRSNPATVGPWDKSLQHGGPPAALIGRTLEQFAARPGLRVARISIEILGPIRLDELSVEVRMVRPGERIELLEATASAGGRTVLRANAWRLRTEPGRSPAISVEEKPPALPAEQPPTIFFTGAESFPYGAALEWRFVEGNYSALGPATVWTRCRIPLVSGEPISPLCRALAMVDSANGISAELELKRWTFVPVDLTLVLHRHPRGEWVGMSARTLIEPDGVGMSFTRLFDQEGYFGRSLHTLYVTPR